jgi:bacteriocin-type transport-associated protein
MREVLLEELTDSDIDWLIATSQEQAISAGQSVIRQGEAVEAFYMLQEGSLVAIVLDDAKSTLGRAFSALSDEQTSQQEISRFSVGDIFGELSFLSQSRSIVTVTALENSSLLVLPYDRLQPRLSQDLEFASRFYRAIAIVLLKRFEQLLEAFSRRKGLQVPPLQDGPLLFGELNDSDISWMVEHASVEEASVDQVIIQAGRSVEFLYIVLRGALALSIVERKRGAMSDIFGRLENGSSEMGRQVARVSRGEIVGETALLDSRLSSFMVRAAKPSLLLVLSRQQMALKLQQDPAMGSRFYRILSILLSSRLEGLINRLGYQQNTYRAGQALSQTLQYNDEINIDLIDSLSLGGARFDWMLKQLNVRSV